MMIFANKIVNGKNCRFNNGNMKRDFTFIDDIVAGTKSAVNENYKCEVFNLGNNKSRKINGYDISN